MKTPNQDHPEMPSLHIYTLANDRVFNDFAVLANSIRYFNPYIGITLIPWDENILRCSQLCQQLNIEIQTHDLTMYDNLGSGFSHEFEKGRRIFRKFAAFFGKHERFLFLDADCIVLSSVEMMSASYEKSSNDILFYAHAAPNRNFTSPEFKAFAKQIIGHPEGYNAAFFLSRRNLFSFEFLRDVARNMRPLESHIGVKHEQAFLNYCCTVLSLTANVISRIDRGLYAAWDTNAKIICRDGKYYFDGRNQPAISVLHYSSHSWRSGVNAGLYRRYLELPLGA
jgi:hypothetical protein